MLSNWHLRGSVSGTHDNVRLLMIGPAESHNPVPAYILEELGCDDRVSMPGFVANDELPSVYGIMDIVVLPSYREGFPYSYLKRLLWGCL